MFSPHICYTSQAGYVTLYIVFFTRSTHCPPYRQHHAVTPQNCLGHGEGDRTHLLILRDLLVLVVAAVIRGFPLVQQQFLMVVADGPVCKGGLAGEVVDTHPGQDHGGGGD